MNIKKKKITILPVSYRVISFVIIALFVVFLNSCQTKHIQSNLTNYKASNIIGYKNEAIIVDSDFVPSMNLINSYAVKNNITVYVTSSYRSSNINLKDIVATPAKMSNHLIGHAIDMNIVYNKKWYDSKLIKKANFKNLPSNVRNFLNEVRDTSNLRWGGDFKAEDPVHIDDHYNMSTYNWTIKFNILHNS